MSQKVWYIYTAWVVVLDEAFARHFFQAVDSCDNDTLTPEAWKKVFDVIGKERTTALEDLVFGMTAHIVNDLPLALIEVGLQNKENESHIYDFYLVNDILGDAITTIQDTVSQRYNPVLRWLDHFAKHIFGRRYDLILTNYAIRISRGLAWYNACRLLDPSSKEQTQKSMVKSVEIFVDDIFNPRVWFVRIFFQLLRAFISIFRKWPKTDTSLEQKVPL